MNSDGSLNAPNAGATEKLTSAILKLEETVARLEAALRVRPPGKRQTQQANRVREYLINEYSPITSFGDRPGITRPEIVEWAKAVAHGPKVSDSTLYRAIPQVMDNIKQNGRSYWRLKPELVRPL